VKAFGCHLKPLPVSEKDSIEVGKCKLGTGEQAKWANGLSFLSNFFVRVKRMGRLDKQTFGQSNICSFAGP